MKNNVLGLEIGQTIWFKREEKNIFQEAIIESFNEGESDLLVSWSHGFGLKARRKIYMHEILWTIPLEHIPWPGNSLPSAPEMPTETADMIRTINQKIFFFTYKLVEILFNFLVFLADNWKILSKIFFILSQIIFVKKIFNNYRSKQFIECVEYFFRQQDCQNKATLWKAIEFTFSERFKLIMGTLGKGFNAFTTETLKGIHFFQIYQFILILVLIFCCWVIIFKMLEKIIRIMLIEILH